MEEEQAAAAAVADPPAEAPKVDGKDDDAILARAQKLISKIVETQANPNPRHLHALATILEAQESRCPIALSLILIRMLITRF